MAVSSSRKWKEQREMSPERNKIWTEPPDCKIKSQRKVPVVYYLCRNGQLEHPHFMEVTLSSSEGLYLKDVLNRLNFLRGKGMAAMYSWSCKRSYNNGFVWQDLVENDFIYPAHGQEYVLKGSELPENPFLETASPPPAGGLDSRRMERRLRNQSCSSIDFNLHEYSAYKADSSARAVVDGSTQTDDNRRRRRSIREAEEKSKEQEPCRNQSREEIEISPPPSDSSPETLETLMKADGRVILRQETVNEDLAVNNQKARTSSSVLMQLLSCGSNSFKDCGPTQRLNLISQYKMRLPRGLESSGLTGGIGRVKLEEKEYFSGSIVETKKEEFPALKRSSSYNADRLVSLYIKLFTWLMTFLN
ncbi:Hypothetical predicted protein [Olea europaea subsp. europaea]|uniref:SOSEKI DIX-like domain-containing protein n=1 Tax=Olea europaea subsp. europaea TaxID=158383 RepID=A0A8S0S6G1_OLEEU|nr:Hypothetical predicted protein [Olea europaea subsp. europaea]